MISLHPSYFGPNMREYLINRLNEEEEGRCTGDHFVICVMDMVDIGEGRVLPGSGQAEYTIKYRAIIWKPFRGETVCLHEYICNCPLNSDHGFQVDAIVTSVKPTGIFTLAGPLSVFIARKVCRLFLISGRNVDANRLARTFLQILSGSQIQYLLSTRIMPTRSSKRGPVYGSKSSVSSLT